MITLLTLTLLSVLIAAILSSIESFIRLGRYMESLKEKKKMEGKMCEFFKAIEDHIEQEHKKEESKTTQKKSTPRKRTSKK